MKPALLLVALAALSLACRHDHRDPCDIDGDGRASTRADYDAFEAALGSSMGDPDYNPAADLDGNGTITVADFGALSERCPLH